MSKESVLFAYLLAVVQPDGSDHIYAIITETMTEAMEAVSAHEPDRPVPRYAGSLGAHSVERIDLEAGEVRLIGVSPPGESRRPSEGLSI